MNIFSSTNQNEGNEPDKLSSFDELKNLVNLTNQLTFKAVSYINSLNSDNHYSINEVSFEDGMVTWRYEKNTSCHCHPEYEIFTEQFELKDFWSWLQKTESNKFWI